MGIEVVVLGAGQDVGRSCVVVRIADKCVMLDCGMHMGFQDHRRYPDFSLVSEAANFTGVIDCVIISHFHLDHCGALPHFTEQCGYDGPVYMTHPTRAICPLLLDDFRKILTERLGQSGVFTSRDLARCMDKCVGVNLHERVAVDDSLSIRAFYAGHVVGAAMFEVRVGEESVVYTGDFNMAPDRHLGSAHIDHVRPDLLISESTYATTVRDSRRTREHEFLHQVHECVRHGGKVLIPVFALGRAQELCILLDTFWEQMGLSVPVYFSSGLSRRANQYYRLYINWTNQRVRSTFLNADHHTHGEPGPREHRNMFEFAHVTGFDMQMIHDNTPMVLFASPGMLHAGTSLEVFKAWAGDAKNLVVIPGYCVKGTVGAKLLSGKRGELEIDKETTVNVKCKVSHLSFSAHADAKGIAQLIKQCEPRNVMLVHGDRHRMAFMKSRIEDELKLPAFTPANGESVRIATRNLLPCIVSRALLGSQSLQGEGGEQEEGGAEETIGGKCVEEGEVGRDLGPSEPLSKRRRVQVRGVLITNPQTTSAALLQQEEAESALGLVPHTVNLALSLGRPAGLPSELQAAAGTLRAHVEPVLGCTCLGDDGDGAEQASASFRCRGTRVRVLADSVRVEWDSAIEPASAARAREQVCAAISSASFGQE